MVVSVVYDLKEFNALTRLIVSLVFTIFHNRLTLVVVLVVFPGIRANRYLTHDRVPGSGHIIRGAVIQVTPEKLFHFLNGQVSRQRILCGDVAPSLTTRADVRLIHRVGNIYAGILDYTVQLDAVRGRLIAVRAVTGNLVPIRVIKFEALVGMNLIVIIPRALLYLV